MRGISGKSNKNLKKSNTYRRSLGKKYALKITKNRRLATEFKVITTAWHESGHAIAVLLNYGYVHNALLCVSNKIDNNSDLGVVIYDGAADINEIDDSDLKNRLLMADITVYQAGLAAEKIFYKDIYGTDQLPYVIKEGSNSDFSFVSDIIKKYNLAPPGKKRYAFKKKCFRQTQKLLSKNWDDVKLVAHALIQKRKIYFFDLKELLIKKSHNKKFWKEQFKIIETLASGIDLTDSQIKKLMKI